MIKLKEFLLYREVKNYLKKIKILIKYVFEVGDASNTSYIYSKIDLRIEIVILKFKYFIFQSKRNAIIDRILEIFVNSVYSRNALKFLKNVNSLEMDNQENREIIEVLQNIGTLKNFEQKSFLQQKKIISILARANVRFEIIDSYQFNPELKIKRLDKPIEDYFSEYSKKINRVGKSLTVDYGNKRKVLNYSEGDAEVREGGFLILQDATIFDNSEVVVTNHGFPLLPMWGFENSKFNISRLDSVLIDTGPDWVGLSLPHKEYSKLNSAISLLSPMSSDFGHFVWDLLCRLITIENNHSQLHQFETILIDSSLPGNFENFLVKIFPRFQFKRVEKESIYYVKNLCVPLPSTHICHDFLAGRNIGLGEHMDFDNLKWLSDRFGNFESNQKHNEGSKIYISRGLNPRWRKVINEKNLIHVLELAGYKIINPDETTMEEIMDSVANSTTVILSAGSVVFNLFFAKPSTQVIILMSDGFIEEVGNAVTPYFFFYEYFLNFQVIRCISSPGRTYLEDLFVPIDTINGVLKQARQNNVGIL
jgi:hypothetical protein